MTASGAELLRLLGSGVRPDVATRAPIRAAGAQTLDFTSLLQKASSGELQSGRDVTIARGVDVTLSPAQMKQLAKAADQAEAAGASQLLAIVGDQTLTIDVASRQVVSASDASQAGSLLTGIEAAVVLASDASEEHSDQLTDPGSTETLRRRAGLTLESLGAVANHSLSDLIAGVAGRAL